MSAQCTCAFNRRIFNIFINNLIEKLRYHYRLTKEFIAFFSLLQEELLNDNTTLVIAITDNDIKTSVIIMIFLNFLKFLSMKLLIAFNLLQKFS